jgi:alpha-beta hydrolase superfamily lysophospholipase
VALLVAGCSEPRLEPWHTERLTEEFTAAKAGDVRSFEDYRALEERLFDQLEREVYARVDTGAAFELARYSPGSPADPRDDAPDWNRSFERVPKDPVGGALLLHGMSDSPYSLRTLAEKLAEQRYHVLGLRLPGHGTAPSGLKHITMHDLTAAVRLGVAHLSGALGGKPLHVIGYSTGAALALDFALDAVQGGASPTPASLVLISPAIRIHAAAALASAKHALSVIPGLDGLAWLQILPEFDPYKYNSFATNAADVTHRITREVHARLTPGVALPPVLAFKSTVDATVTTEAVVDALLARLDPLGGHELVLFDINRSAAKSRLLIEDPGPLTDRLLAEADLPFAVTFVTNQSPASRAVVARHKAPFAAELSDAEPLGVGWPAGVISLSHVALPFAPDDPLYGRRPPQNENALFLGEMAIRGERGLLNLSPDWLLRLRYNPFYGVLESRVLDWLESVEERSR